MKQICKFDKSKDIQVHVPSLSVNIAKAIEQGGVISSLVPQDFNNMDIDTAENGVRLREPFDAVEYQVALSESKTQFSSGTGNIITPTNPPTEPSTAE